MIASRGVEPAAGPAGRTEAARPLLEVEGLTVALRRRAEDVVLVDDVTFSVARGETVGIVGETGSGKSLTALAVLQVLPASVRQSSGRIRFDGIELGGLRGRALRDFRREHLGAIFQDPQVSLNPAFTVGNQLVETLRLSRPHMSRGQATAEAADLLASVGINRPRDRLDQYPHELSGGMAQRVMIGLAIAGKPTLLIADEPTTALDVTVQAQILELLASLRRQHGLSLLLISHDLGVVGQVADRVLVLYAGQVVNEGLVPSILETPRHPYTEALLAARPSMALKGHRLRAIPGTVPTAGAAPPGCRFAPRCAYVTDPCIASPVALVTEEASEVRCVRSGELRLTAATVDAVTVIPQRSRTRSEEAALVEVRGLVKDYARRATMLRRSVSPVCAVSDVSFDIKPGETLGLVGESGAGKSTVGRIVLGLTAPTSGTVRFAGLQLGSTTRRRSLEVRSKIQVVFQNPYATLDPLMTVGESIREPLDTVARLDAPARMRRVLEVLAQVGLDGGLHSRYPAELSGGQRQRVAIARALAPVPRLVVCDEPVSSLDVSTQAQIVNLLEDVQRETGVAYLFIGHDLGVVHHISDRIAVMYAGQIVEMDDADTVYARPRHPYTRELLASRPGAPPITWELPTPTGEPPAKPSAAGACAFSDRCPHAWAVCREVAPPLVATASGGLVRCHLHVPAVGQRSPDAVGSPD